MGTQNGSRTLWDDIWAELTPEDLPGDLEDIARFRGMDTARRVVEVAGRSNLWVPKSGVGSHIDLLERHLPQDLVDAIVDDWGGSMPYIPSPDSIIGVYRERHLLREWDGQNEYALAQRYRLSVVQIRELIRDQMRAIQTELDLGDVVKE